MSTADFGNNMLPSFVEIALGGIIALIAKKWGIRELYVMIAFGVMGLLVCSGMILVPGLKFPPSTIGLLALIPVALAIWTHVLRGTWRDAKHTVL
jgi:cadmium resistance protein CadD (predicted permease)